jgi:hypothetical protein
MGADGFLDRPLPSPAHTTRRLVRLFSTGKVNLPNTVGEVEVRVERGKRFGREGSNLGAHNTFHDTISIRPGIGQDEARKTLIHEGVHFLYPEEWHTQATEDEVERLTHEIHERLGPRQRRLFDSFIPED